MRGRLTLLVGIAAGYVLGARAGRGRYEQIKSQADQLWHDPRVQSTVSSASSRVAETAREVAPEIQAKLAEAAGAATAKVTEVASSSTPSSQHRSSPLTRRVSSMSNDDNAPLSRPRAELLPEEIAAGSDDPAAQAQAINDDSNERAESVEHHEELIARTAEEATGGETSAK